MIILYYSACGHTSGDHTCSEMQCTKLNGVLQWNGNIWLGHFASFTFSLYAAVEQLSSSQQRDGPAGISFSADLHIGFCPAKYSLVCIDMPGYSSWGVELHTDPK